MFWLLLACTGGPHEGTVVGNPGDAYAKLAPVSDTLQVDVMEVNATQLWLEGCDGAVQQQPVDTEAGQPVYAPMSVPSGRWCRLGLELDPVAPGVLVAGLDLEGAAFELHLGLSWLELDAPGGLWVDGQSYVLELGEPDWLSRELLQEVDESGVVVVQEGDPLHDLLVDSLSFRSALFEDGDGDGQISESERLAGAVARGEAREEDVADTGGAEGFVEVRETRGCGTQETVVVSWLLLPLLGLGRRRRLS